MLSPTNEKTPYEQLLQSGGEREIVAYGYASTTEYLVSSKYYLSQIITLYLPWVWIKQKQMESLFTIANNLKLWFP